MIGQDCTFKAIIDEMEILTNSEASETDQALAMVLIGHWIGDLHQPLHVSFSDDLGGNNVKTSGTTCRGYYNRRTRKRETPCCIQSGIAASSTMEFLNIAGFKIYWDEPNIQSLTEPPIGYVLKLRMMKGLCGDQPI